MTLVIIANTRVTQPPPKNKMTIVTSRSNLSANYSSAAKLKREFRESFPEPRQRGMLFTMKITGTLEAAAASLRMAFIAMALLGSGALALRAKDNPPPDPHSVPVVDGGIGPCSVAFTVKDQSGSPVYNSRIRVHIAYGVFHKMDLEVGTNVDGKARFNGLPNRVKRPPLEFSATKDGLEGSATYDPGTEACTSAKAIAISKPSADSSQP